MNVQSFPRPPRLEKISRHVQINYAGKVIADTNEAYWVLETHHPPSMCILISNTLTNRTAYLLGIIHQYLFVPATLLFMTLMT